jgi:CDP-diacylglycerol---serine O-phosphatidyltransferase
MRTIHLLPNLITLGNAFCGVLAISTAIDGLATLGSSPELFYVKMERACALVFLGMVFDALDGFVARLTGASSHFGAQLDSFADAITFGLTPAILAKCLAARDLLGAGADWSASSAGASRLHFLAAVAYALLAILRLVRFNLEHDNEGPKHNDGPREHRWFSGLPSPAAAGLVCSTLWLYLILRYPDLEVSAGTPTPLRRLMGWMEGVNWSPLLDPALTAVLLAMPCLGLLMVSRVPYRHFGHWLTRGRMPFNTLVWVVFALLLFYLAPVPLLFLGFLGFVLSGPLGPLRQQLRAYLAARRAAGRV